MPDVYWVHLSDGNFGQAYRFIGGPIEDPAAFPELFQALGLAAAAWARMEQHVDAILLQINKAEHSSDTLDLYDEQHPKPFTGKIKILRDYFNKHPALARYMDTIREFANGLMKLSDDRNEWIHGMIEGYDPKARIVKLFKTTYREKRTTSSTARQKFHWSASNISPS